MSYDFEESAKRYFSTFRDSKAYKKFRDNKDIGSLWGVALAVDMVYKEALREERIKTIGESELLQEDLECFLYGYLPEFMDFIGE